MVSFFKSKKTTFRSVFANNSVDHRHHHKFIKYEKRLRKEGKNMLGLPIKQNLCHFSTSLDARSVFANNSVFNLHIMKVSTENDNNFGYEKITILGDNIPLKG
jgi:hypothetical protein